MASKARPSSALGAIALVLVKVLVTALILALTIAGALIGALLAALGQKPSRRRYRKK